MYIYKQLPFIMLVKSAMAVGRTLRAAHFSINSWGTLSSSSNDVALSNCNDDRYALKY